MSSDIKQDRSPRSPKIPLKEALEYTRKLYGNAGRSIIPREMAAKAMGYGGLNGAALTTLATVSQYGLLEKQGNKVGVSPLALRIFHPSLEGPDSAIREAALSPSVFQSVFENHHQLSEPLLANHLVHQGFTMEAAKKVASVYKENAEFAKLDIGGIDEANDKPLADIRIDARDMAEPKGPLSDITSPFTAPKETKQGGENVLAEYSIPLGSNKATLVFIGEKLAAEDFDDLKDFIDFSKRQFERAKKSAASKASSEEVEAQS